MISLRKFMHAGLLALTSLSVAPVLASAQESRGHFMLTHSVLWEKASVPAGLYQFTFKGSMGGVLILTKVDSPYAGFMFLVRDTEESAPSDTSALVLHGIAPQSYVSAITLPDAGITLHFSPPPQTAKKEIARAWSGYTASGR